MAFVYSYPKYLLLAYYLPGKILGAKDTAVSKTKIFRNLPSWNLHSGVLRVMTKPGVGRLPAVYHILKSLVLGSSCSP